MAVFGEQGFGVELYAFHRQRFVAHAHDLAVVGPGGDFQAVGQCVAVDNQAVIAGAGNRIGQLAEHALVVVVNRRDFAVHQRFGAYGVAAEGLADGLMAEADAHNRQFAGEMADGVYRNTGFFGGAGAGADNEIVGRECGDFVEGDVVVAAHHHFLAEFGKILHDVVGKRIVVVYHQ